MTSPDYDTDFYTWTKVQAAALREKDWPAVDVAHLDLKKPMEEAVPMFDTALQVADVYWKWVRKVIEPTRMHAVPFRADYDMWKTEAFTIVSRYPHP